jgi:hypothetical protein
MSVTVDTPVNWKITQGEAFSLQLEYQDPDGNPIDISDYTIVFTVKDHPQGDIISATCTVGNGIDLSGSSSGIINLMVSSSKTAVFNYPRAYYKIKATDPYSEEYVLLQGWFEVAAGEYG